MILIIAADEGIMPQTREHLAIMDVLDIKHGIIVLTKVDAVDEEILMLAEEEVREFVEDTFLQDSPIIQVSSVTKKGIDILLEELMVLTEVIPEKKSNGFFRLYIDRIFSQPGFGTIVNGSVLDGELHKNDPLYLIPGSKEIKIRRIERHGEETDIIRAGDRASLNLANFKVKDFKRGMMLSGKKINTSTLIDAKIKLFKDVTPLNLWSQVILLLGTIRIMVRVHLLDTNYLEPGNEALVQIYFPKSVVLQLNDNFILRKSSGDKTLGGGVVIDPYPLHHRRRRSSQIDIVKEMSSGEVSDLIAAEVRKKIFPVSYRVIANHLALRSEELIDPIFQDLRGDIVFFQPENDIILLEKKLKTNYLNKVLNSIIHYHKKNPLFDTGRTFNELLGIFGENRNDINKITLKMILSELVEDGKLLISGNTWILRTHKVIMDDSMKEKISAISDYVKNDAKEFVDPKDVWLDLKKYFSQEKEAETLAKYLIQKGDLVNVKQLYIHSDNLNSKRDLLVNYLLEHKENGITTSYFRNLIQSNRNTAVLYLENFDSEGITQRKNNDRFLTYKYLKSIDRKD